ncbi:tyrosine aminotransferase [Gigaspora margarita]|uniref:Tyrosine aminotransferase n=1 Tax=Gigaspora margarita TaxID=4874 RepID=A0A8H3WYG5_GIGMA|nr:tyrosine aminotransferase [Gigaspora margarita]
MSVNDRTEDALNNKVKNVMTSRSKWHVPASIVSKRTVNPIRETVFNMRAKPNPDKELISLALGDPTIFGNFKIHESCIDAVIKQLQSYKANGYLPAFGCEEARKALAKKFSTEDAPLTIRDIVLGSGASDALNLAIGALCNEDQNILLPRPGFSIYQTISQSKGIECRYYNLLPDRNWEIDLDQLVTLIDDKTACILINNPSNPCGSNFSRQHLESIIQVCETYKLVIIADEIYEDMVFGSTKFYPIASLTKSVPILKVSGLAKRFLVPGWRVGWVFIYDQNGILDEIRDALLSLSNIILGANSLIQHSIPNIIFNTPDEFYQDTINQFERSASVSASVLSEIRGLHVIVPQGAMYMMIGINIEEFKGIKDDVEFAAKLLEEESVMCLPGQCFHYPNYIRITLIPPTEKLKEACDRIREFCIRHHI